MRKSTQNSAKLLFKNIPKIRTSFMNVLLVLIRKHTCRQSNPASVSLLSIVDSLPFVPDNALCEIYFSTLLCSRLQF